MANEDDGKMRKAADYALLVLLSRLSGPALLGVCSYICVAVVNLKTDVAALTAGVNATIAGIQKDVDELQKWRDSLGEEDKKDGKHASL
jgi:hypothetical protein